MRAGKPGARWSSRPRRVIYPSRRLGLIIISCCYNSQYVWRLRPCRSRSLGFGSWGVPRKGEGVAQVPRSPSPFPETSRQQLPARARNVPFLLRLCWRANVYGLLSMSVGVGYNRSTGWAMGLCVCPPDSLSPVWVACAVWSGQVSPSPLRVSTQCSASWPDGSTRLGLEPTVTTPRVDGAMVVEW